MNFCCYLCTRFSIPIEEFASPLMGIVAWRCLYVTRDQYITDYIPRRISRCLHIKRCDDPKVFAHENGRMLNKKELHWFPLRIRNSSMVRLQAMKERLDRQDSIQETYIPLSYLKVSLTKMDFAPFLINYIFVRTTYEALLIRECHQLLRNFITNWFVMW